MSFEDRSGNSGSGEEPVVHVERRRPAEPTGSEGREQAEAPHREGREDQGGSALPPSRTSQTGGFSLPSLGDLIPANIPLPNLSGRTLLMLGVLVLVCVCGLGGLWFCGLLGGGGANPGTNAPTETAALPSYYITDTPEVAAEPYIATDTPVVTAEAAVAPATAGVTAVPAVVPTGKAGGKTWLVMLYEDADDKILEQDIYTDLNEAERVGSSDSVKIVAQIDRFAGAFTGDGNWTSTRRYYVTKDNDLQTVHSQLITDLGEKNMSDPNTLVDFVTWAMQKYPADKQLLILSDHGMGWPGGFTDPAPVTRADNSTPLSSAIGNDLPLNKLDAALQTIRDRTGLDKFEMIGLDACLMSQVEVLSVLAPHARYAVVSEETEPALGWAYASFLKALEQNPAMNGADLGKLIVSSYVKDDQLIVDDQARANLVRQGSPMGGLFGSAAVPSASEVASEMGHDVTLSAVDLSAVPALLDSVNGLSFAMQKAQQSEVARARSYAQSFTSIFGEDVPASYIDLGNFAQLLKQTRAGTDVNTAADTVLAALKQAVVAETHGPGKPGATGVAIYFPNSQLYQSPVAGPESYTVIASRFSSESLWDDFLAYHYTGRQFDAAARTPVTPQPQTPVTAPGAGTFQLSPITLSATTVSRRNTITLSTDISGPNLGYVYIFTGYYDPQANSIFVADMDYLESSDTRQVDGVYYPVWPSTAFKMEFDWEPLMFSISDGTTTVNALLAPQDYGATPEEATYTVDGTYTDASGDSRYARLYFRNGLLHQVFGFTGQSPTGAPAEIYPQAGDTFTVLETWLDLDSQGRVVQKATQPGGKLTFSDQMFTWKTLDAAPGKYVVGFIAADLDGNSKEVYKSVTVK